MPFCMQCGEKLPDGARFCSKCGTPLGEITNNIKEESMMKCPNCGASVGRIDAICRYCGSQIVDREASSAVTKFAEELSKIEKEGSGSDGNRGLMANFMKACGTDKVLERAYGNKTFERKLSLIKAFPIPNTVEEISEFVLLAVSNIDVGFGKKSAKNSLWGRPGSTYYTDISLANAWVNKLEQAYHKAELSFYDDPIFQRIKKIYEEKMRELNRL